MVTLYSRRTARSQVALVNTTSPSFTISEAPIISVPFPSNRPSVQPSQHPSNVPTSSLEPTSAPTSKPSAVPTIHPTTFPSDVPTRSPTAAPTTRPTFITSAKETWSDIQVTIIFTSLTAVGFIVAFEIFRRIPHFRATIYDVRRSKRSEVTPPPLMKGFMEWCFLSTDPAYITYARIANEGESRKNMKIDEEAMAGVKDFFEEELPPGVVDSNQADEKSLSVASDQWSRWSDDSDFEVKDQEHDDWGETLIVRGDSPKRNGKRQGTKDQPSNEIENRLRELTSRPTEDDLYLLESGESLSAVKKIRRQKMGAELIPGYVEKNGKLLPANEADNLITGGSRRDLGKSKGKNGSRRDDRILSRSLGHTDTKEEDAHLMSNRFQQLRRRVFGSVKKTAFDMAFDHHKAAGKETDHKTEQQKLMQQLASVNSVNKLEISPADKELLRCIGLDFFVTIRFLRMAGEISFYTFLVALVVLIPTFMSSDYDGLRDSGSNIVVVGYYELTMNMIEPTSAKLWICTLYQLFFIVFVLRRLWVEWKYFIPLRFEFLSGRHAVIGEEKETEQYSLSCIVNSIPQSHRRDQELFDFFNAIWPGEIKRAEMLVNASSLTDWIQERQHHIEEYENTYAIQYHKKKEYERAVEKLRKRGADAGMWIYIFSCCRRDPQKPKEITITASGFCEKKKASIKALPFHLNEIKRLNRVIERERERIADERKKIQKFKADKTSTRNGVLGLGVIDDTLALRQFIEELDLISDTGFVEFRTLTAKQSAVQCNVAGTSNFMKTAAAPDPKDVVWENATAPITSIRKRYWHVNILLLVLILAWTAVLQFINALSNLQELQRHGYVPSWIVPDEGSFADGLVKGYLPVILLESLMYLLQFAIRFVCIKYIKFKTHSEVENYVLVWHFFYRLANIIILTLSASLIQLLRDFGADPEAAAELLATGITGSSDFFLDNIIVGAGTEMLVELLQLPNLAYHLVLRNVITIEAKSQRVLERLRDPGPLEFGEHLPILMFPFMSAAIFSTSTPLVNGAAFLFYLVATKVYTHQALYVYVQKYESGGKLMYILNRMIFVIVYASIFIFLAVLGLKQAGLQVTLFAIAAVGATYAIDHKIQHTFIIPSLTLALINARELDVKQKLEDERLKKFRAFKEADAVAHGKMIAREKAKSVLTGEVSISAIATAGDTVPAVKTPPDVLDSYVYRQPFLRRRTGDSKPKPYRESRKIQHFSTTPRTA